MAGNAARMSPEFALVTALETVPALRGKVSAMQPPKGAKSVFAFYIPTADTEDQALDGPTGLQHFSAAVHLVAASHRRLQLLAAEAKQAVLGMRGKVYRTPEEDEDVGQKGAVLIEDTETEQNSPDLYEVEVGLYRRIYTVRLDYQTEEVNEDEEVISG